MNHGGQWDFEFGNLKYVIAHHTSSFPDGSYGGQPGGFVIEGEHKNIYIAGVPMFHPAAALPQPRFRPLIEEDFQKLPQFIAEAANFEPVEDEEDLSDAEQLSLF
jgi:hypothetical protein